jgi:DNA-directed RNA polymerase subunit RPC12/RpoP
MLIVDVECPSCNAKIIVDRKLWTVGTIRLRCPECTSYFLPKGSPGSTTIETAAVASVPIELYEPPEHDPRGGL